ncbi:MAG: DUF362 domain-containing protein [Methanobacterium sp.]
MAKNIIGIKKVNELNNQSEIEEKVYDLLDQMKRRDFLNIPPNANIMIKPNVCLVKCCESGTTVDPFIVKYLVDWLLNNFEVNKIIIGEADATQLNIDVAFKVLGWEEIFSAYPKVELLNLSKDEKVKVEINGLHFKEIEMSNKYMSADYLISVAKLKTHTMTYMTGILKNQYGANPIKYKLQYHEDLDNVICDLNNVRIPDLSLIDGLIAMEGKGPVSGIPKPMGLIIIGNDPVATDNACARIMEINPKKISHINLSAEKGVGIPNYEVFGESIENVKKKFTIVSTTEKFLGFMYSNKLIHRIPLWKNVLKFVFR